MGKTKLWGGIMEVAAKIDKSTGQGMWFLHVEVRSLWIRQCEKVQKLYFDMDGPENWNLGKRRRLAGSSREKSRACAEFWRFEMSLLKLVEVMLGHV